MEFEMQQAFFFSSRQHSVVWDKEKEKTFVKNQRDLNHNPIFGENAMADFSNRYVKILERSITERQKQ